MFVAAHLGTGLHQAVVAHEWCEEHERVGHAGHGDADADGRRPVGLGAAPVRDADGHEHCALGEMSEAPAASTPAPPASAPAPGSDRLVVGGQGVVRAVVGLWRLAPKNSPPA